MRVVSSVTTSPATSHGLHRDGSRGGRRMGRVMLTQLSSAQFDTTFSLVDG